MMIQLYLWLCSAALFNYDFLIRTIPLRRELTIEGTILNLRDGVSRVPGTVYYGLVLAYCHPYLPYIQLSIV